jgi:hypothetical protein
LIRSIFDSIDPCDKKHEILCNTSFVYLYWIGSRVMRQISCIPYEYSSMAKHIFFWLIFFLLYKELFLLPSVHADYCILYNSYKLLADLWSNDQQIFIISDGETISRSCWAPFVVEARIEPSTFRPVVQRFIIISPVDLQGADDIAHIILFVFYHAWLCCMFLWKRNKKKI